MNESAESIVTGQPPDTAAFHSGPDFDGPVLVMLPRRPELLGDEEPAWWADVWSWTEWARDTYRLSQWIPPCWSRHPALVEEVMALFLYWVDAWGSNCGPRDPSSFLRELDASLSRIDQRWQVSCTPDKHRRSIAAPSPANFEQPVTGQWWSMSDFEPTGRWT